MKHDTRTLIIQDDVLYKAVLTEARMETSKNTGNSYYLMKFKIKINECINTMANKYFSYDLNPDYELYHTAKKLGAIDEEGMFDDELLINKEVEVTLETSTYNNKVQRNVKEILPL